MLIKSQNCFEQKTSQSSTTMTQDSLKQEILELRKELRNEFVTREALEEAIQYSSVLHDSTTHDSLISKTTKDLMKDVAALEVEVLYLEKYLLSMYQKVWTSREEPSCMMNRIPKQTSVNHRQMHRELRKSNETNTKANLMTRGVEFMKSGGNSHTDCGDILGANLLADSTVQRSHSSLSRHSAIPLGTPQRAVAKAIDSYQCLPLSMLEGSASCCVGTSAHDHFWEAPSRISEEMIKRISAIIVQLADPPLPRYDFPPSSELLSSSSSRSSPQERHKSWSQLGSGTEKSWLDKSLFHNETFEDYPSFSTSIEVQGICRDAQNLRKIRSMLQKYRCFVSALKLVEPQKMKHEEKLAFWINVHNALVMHALLVNGVQQNNAKRISMILKSAYNIGGHTISVDMIQCSILECRLPRPGQWLPTFFSQRGKDKKNKFSLKSYAIVNREARVHFALCFGSKSDPVVRMYTPKGVFQELELAKDEYIKSNMMNKNIEKQVKKMIEVPKKVESFIKDSNLCAESVLLDELIQVQQHCIMLPPQSATGRKIVWVPHCFSFRYLIANELVS